MLLHIIGIHSIIAFLRETRLRTTGQFQMRFSAAVVQPEITWVRRLFKAIPRPRSSQPRRHAEKKPEAIEFQVRQHALRGEISKLRAKTFSLNARDPFPEFARQVKRCLLTSRRRLPITEFDRYLGWVNEVLPHGLAGFDVKSSDYASLGGFVELKEPVSLNRELAWMSRRLRFAQIPLNEFVSRTAALEAEAFAGRWDVVLQSLDTLTDRFGHSFWSVQTRLAVLQAGEGLEAQKKHVSELRAHFRNGLLGFVAFYTGVRNEARMAWPHYVNLIDDRIKDTRYESCVEHYLRYRLLQQLPESASGLADILRLEQSGTAVEQYETLVAVLQFIAKGSNWANHRGAALDALDALSGIEDFRLEKLRLALNGGSGASLPHRSARPLSDMIEGRTARALRTIRRAHKMSAPDPWFAIYEAAALAHSSVDRDIKPKDSPSLERLLASILRRDKSSIFSAGEAIKTLHNFSTLPIYAALRDFGVMVTTPNADRLLQLTEVNLNARAFGVEDAAWSTLVSMSGAAEAVWSGYHADRTISSTPPAMVGWMASLNALHRAAYQDALDALAAIEGGRLPEFMCRLAARMEIEAHIALGNRSNVINLVADEAAANKLAPAFLPIARALGHFRWPDFKPHTDSLAAAIALDALWRSTEEDNVATMLRYAFTYQLKRAAVERPSTLLDVEGRYDRSRLLYYLKEICVPAIMDMSPLFKSSREVGEERQSVCAALIAIDPINKDDYSLEIFESTNALAVAQGLRIVDSSRIHVGTDAIARWARRRIEPDFARYFDLVRAGIGVDGDFDQILRDVFSTIGARQVFFTPDDESDAILTDMLRLLGEEFLSNSDYGLDYFLSKRVRHQSFIGLIRGPLEFANIITSKETEFGAYKPDTHWGPRFAHLGHETMVAVQDRLSRFANQFDAHLIDLKDRRLQIKSPTTPEGLFDITITNQMLIVLRGVTQTGLSFDDFLRMIFQLFWSALEGPLAAARHAIGSTLKTELSDLFDILRADLHALVGEDPAFSELSVAIGEVSAEVQRSLDSAASWFIRPGGQHAAHKFTLRQSIEIAVQSALKSHRAFDPDLRLDVQGDVELQTPDLLLITDAIFVALDNVRAHSQIKRKVSIEIACRVSDDQSQVQLEVRNEVSPGIDYAAAQVRLDRLRALIEAGEVSKGARTEGGSGFLKIAAALRHSADGAIDFRFEDRTFVLAVRLKPTRYTVAVVRS